jgi:hypothetical protein
MRQRMNIIKSLPISTVSSFVIYWFIVDGGNSSYSLVVESEMQDLFLAYYSSAL